MERDRREKRQRPEDAVPARPGNRHSEEEEQVEKFFSLLKSIREMREQRPQRAGSGAPRKRPNVDGSAWTPTFQWEDFAVVSGGCCPAGIPTVPTEEGRQEKEKKEEEGGTCLDLKLSL